MGNGLYFSSGIDKGFEKDIARMNAQLNKLSGTVQKEGQKMDNTFKDLTRSLGGMISVLALGAAGKKLITFSNELETALTEVATISQAVTEDFDGYKTALIGLSTEGSQSAKELTEAFYDVVSAGYDGAAGLELLSAAQQASTAGFVEVATAADGITTVLNAWGKSADQAASVSDIFFKTVEKGKTTFPELGANIAQVAPLAASMGVSFEEVSGAIATITKQGTPTTQALTQIRSALVAMNEQFGAAYFETNTLQDGFKELLNISETTGKTITEVTGRVEGALAVLATTGKNAEVAAQDLDAMNTALGATAVAAEKVFQSTEQQVAMLKNNILAAFEPLGARASSIIGDLAKRLNEAFQSGDIQKYAEIILHLVKAFAIYKASVIAMNQVNKIRKSILLANIRLQEQMRLEYALSGQTASKSALRMAAANKTLTRSFKTLSAAFKANPIGWIATALSVAIPLVKNFSDTFESTGKKMKKINEEIGKQYAEESAGLAVIQSQLNDQNITYEQKQKLINQLNTEYGEYLPNLIDENSSIEDINAALKVANDRLREQIRLKVLNQKAAELSASIYELEQKILDASDDSMLNTVGIVGDVLRARFGLLTKDLAKQKELFEKILEDINKASIQQAEGQPTKKAEKTAEEILSEQEKARKDKEKRDEEARKKALKQLELNYQKEKNEIIAQYQNREELEREFQERMLKNDLEYLDEKRKLTIDEMERLLLEQEILQRRFEDENLKKLESRFGGTISMELRGVKTSTKDNPSDSIEKSTSDSLQAIDQALSQMGDSIVTQLVDLSTNIVGAFETLNSESSSSADKISGIISLIVAAGELIKDIVTNIYTEEADEQIRINQQLANRIKAETVINRLVRERQEMELNRSAFLDANYKDRYNLALQQLDDSEAAINSSLAALSQNFVLTATGHGESWLGINKTAEQYSFTLAQILDQSDTLSGVELGGTISNILDPADIFGGAASGEAYQDAFKQVKSAFESTLKSMGKTAADMANFSKEEWVDFYTILDESGYIADEGTKALVEGMKEAQEAYTEALDTMRNIISEIAGSLGDALGDSIVNAVANGTDALNDFEKSLNKVFLQMAKAEMNQLFFQGLFEQLQAEMEESMAGGDQNWQDDLLRFYDKLPDAISQSEDFLRQFDAQLKAMGFEGVTTDGTTAQSTAGQIRQAITEETGTILAGHIGAVRLSNERIANYSEEILDLAVQNLVTLNKIKVNTDYLPQIAENTRKTAQKLGGL